MLQPGKRIHQPPEHREGKKQKKKQNNGVHRVVVPIKKIEPDARKDDEDAKKKTWEEDLAAQAKKEKAAAEERRAAKFRTVRCCLCNEKIGTYPREDLGADAPVDVGGICQNCCRAEQEAEEILQEKKRQLR